MKYILLASVMIFCISAGPVQAGEKTVSPVELNQKLDELASLPEGLMVTHTPDPVRYTLHTPSLSGVQWQHSTAVSSKVGPVSIVEFGYFVERNGQWEYSLGTEVPDTYSASDFAKKYDCPNSELQPGVTYTDALSRSIIDCVPEQVVMWYYIGLDAKGNRVKGEASLKLLTELAD